MSEIAIADDSPPADAKAGGPGKKVVAFAKEWGSVATLLVALLYTFPSDIIGKALDWRNRSFSQSRSALNVLSDLNAQKLIALHQIKDDFQTKASVSQAYNIRIFNVLTENQDDFESALPRLSGSEAYLLATSFMANGLVGDSMKFFRAAIDKSRGRNASVYATASRDFGWALFTKSPSQDIPQARLQYLQALSTIAEPKNYLDPSEYAGDLYAFSLWEMIVGDWKCGVDNLAIAGNITDRLMSLNPQGTPQYSGIKNVWLAAASQRTQTTGQPADGCAYTLPRLRLPGDPL